MTHEACQTEYATLNDSFHELRSSFEACGCGVDPCGGGDGDADDDGTAPYDVAPRLVALFVVLVCSLLGVLLPLVGRKWLAPYVFVLGKHFGTGILLACALVHMLEPAAEAFASPCLGPGLSDEYGAYAYLFTMLAIVFMFSLDLVLRTCMLSRHAASSSRPAATTPSLAEVGADDVERSVKKPDDDTDNHQIVDPAAETSSPSPRRVVDSATGNETTTPAAAAACASDDAKFASIAHVHSGATLSELELTMQAYMLEFGFTVHSVFIGLAMAVSSEAEMVQLLVALSFHQFFEGVGLGVRLGDATGVKLRHKFVLGSIFAFSAPIGIAVGTGLTSAIQPNAFSFAVAQGVLDSLCAGILLYITFVLMLLDFPRDFATYAAQSAWKAVGLLFALWSGAGAMAFLGKYL